MTRADLAANLRDPKVHAERLAEAVLTAVGTALVAPARLDPRLRGSLHGAAALAAGAGTAYFVSGIDEVMSEDESGRRVRAISAGAAVGALMLGAGVLGVKADAAAEEWLVRRGVKRPRIWMGLGFGVAGLALAWIGDLAESQKAEQDADDEERESV